MSQSTHPPAVELLEWDTQFFGFRVARFQGDRLPASEMEAVDAWCREHQIRCLYFLCGLDHPASTQAAEANDFHLVDVRMTFQHTLSGNTPPHTTSSAVNLRTASPLDVGEMQKIAGESHLYSRFSYDTHFPPGTSARLYETWVKVSCEGYADQVFVAEVNGEVTGYITCHKEANPADGRIGLIGVKTDMQGQGVATHMLMSALDWFSSQGIEAVYVTTQGGNSAAQRLYQRCGFLTHDVRLWYHKWYSRKQDE